MILPIVVTHGLSQFFKRIRVPRGGNTTLGMTALHRHAIRKAIILGQQVLTLNLKRIDAKSVSRLLNSRFHYEHRLWTTKTPERRERRQIRFAAHARDTNVGHIVAVCSVKK